jgi:hypothetical protein
MKLFTCNNCSQLVHFENTHCVQCGKPLGFESDKLDLHTLETANDGIVTLLNQPNIQYRYCANHAYNVCNWLVPVTSTSPFCRACIHNHTIPNLSKPEYVQRWMKIENAKHRLIYSLLRLQLPLENKIVNPEQGLSFDFVASEKTGDPNQKPLLTGHLNGLITLNIAEADDIEREMARLKMEEVYRTVLGHFRHETGHYYWDRLIANTDKLEPFRKLFGNEQQDYKKALERYYASGTPEGRESEYISAYAAAHPWEDWAETWAHYLHIIDTLETAHSFGLRLDPEPDSDATDMAVDITTDPYRQKRFSIIIKQWMPLTIAMNSLNRSMGLPDSYPFIIGPVVIQKLQFIHQVCFDARNRQVENRSYTNSM